MGVCTALGVLAVVLGAWSAPAAHGSPDGGAGPRIAAEQLQWSWLSARQKTKRSKRGRPQPRPTTPQDATSSPAAPQPDPPPSWADTAFPKELPQPPPAPTGYRAVALLPLQTFDITDDLATDLEGALLREIDETSGLRGISPHDVVSDLRSFNIDIGLCDGDARCLGQALRYARSHLALEARVAAIGGTLSVSMRLLDVAEGREVNRVAETVSLDPTARAQELHRLAVQLLTPETYVGTLVVQCAQAGAEVYLDDQLIGVTPLPRPISGLPAGPHILRITKPGFADLNRFVDVVFNRSSTVSFDLDDTTITGHIVEEVSQTGFGELFILSRTAGLEVRIDGEPRGTTPLTAPIAKVAAGVRRLSLRKSGVEPVVQEVRIEPGRRTDLVVDLGPGDALTASQIGVVDAGASLPTAEALTPSARAPDGESWAPTWRFYTGLAAGGLGVVAIGVAGSYAAKVRGLNNERAADQRTVDDILADGTGGLSASDLETLASIQERSDQRLLDGPKYEALQWASLVAGFALAGAGAWLVLQDLFLRNPQLPAAADPSVALQPVLAPGTGAGLVLRATW